MTDTIHTGEDLIHSNPVMISSQVAPSGSTEGSSLTITKDQYDKLMLMLNSSQQQEPSSSINHSVH